MSNEMGETRREVEGGPWVFVPRESPGSEHDCPSCRCSTLIRAIMWNGFNAGSIRKFLQHHAPETETVYSIQGYQLFVSCLDVSLPPGWWLYVRNGTLDKAGPLDFATRFGKVD